MVAAKRNARLWQASGTAVLMLGERGATCVFPPKGTCYSFRKGKRTADGQIKGDTRHQDLSPEDLNGATLPTTNPQLAAGSDISQSPASRAADDIWKNDPFAFFTADVKENFLRCSYKWSFHHFPHLLIEIRNRTLDTALAWAILAVAIRFSTNAPEPFTAPLEASNAFAEHARSILLPDIDDPTIPRIQALLLLTGHSWGAGQGRRAWTWLGMASRMVQMMSLFEATGTPLAQDEFIAAEEKRRTAWTCFLMDSLLSGGKERKRILSADDMQIQLPCDTDCFYFGEPVSCETIDGKIIQDSPPTTAGRLGILAYTIRAADIWGDVAQWAISPKEDQKVLWYPHSKAPHLLAALHQWRDALPSRLRYNVSTLRAHIASNEGQAFCYLHAIYFMSVMFVHRANLPEPGISKDYHLGLSPRQSWLPLYEHSRRELLQAARQVCEMLAEIRDCGFCFVRGLVPWIGFTIYSSIGTLLYYYYFPDPADSRELTAGLGNQITDGCLFLKDMKNSWPMAETWHETIKKMHAFYSNIRTHGDKSTNPVERQQMRIATVDYGALQSSPVQDKAPKWSHSTVRKYPLLILYLSNALADSRVRDLLDRKYSACKICD
ncbi:MAG: hypothetical protein M1820_002546 [Bogoriella megaspora]|nr:MAG: hypothetical protein M1820_002546 [Bogoriella megaspora]